MIPKGSQIRSLLPGASRGSKVAQRAPKWPKMTSKWAKMDIFSSKSAYFADLGGFPRGENRSKMDSGRAKNGSSLRDDQFLALPESIFALFCCFTTYFVFLPDDFAVYSWKTISESHNRTQNFPKIARIVWKKLFFRSPNSGNPRWNELISTYGCTGMSS